MKIKSEKKRTNETTPGPISFPAAHLLLIPFPPAGAYPHH
jgi:hypothetical protein